MVYEVRLEMFVGNGIGILLSFVPRRFRIPISGIFMERRILVCRAPCDGEMLPNVKIPNDSQRSVAKSSIKNERFGAAKIVYEIATIWQ